MLMQTYLRSLNDNLIKVLGMCSDWLISKLRLSVARVSIHYGRSHDDEKFAA